uniref:C2H2-type domain-containing protein n=1 Tax=Panagrolaimus sp. PS1159 TaxID=55785 RepID=A0AC35FGF7_9BILA
MSDDPDNTAITAAATTASSLRRSKRNKFHLDVAAIHHGRSRSPAITHFTIQHSIQQPPQPQPAPSTSTAAATSTTAAASVIKASPRNSPICTVTKQQQQDSEEEEESIKEETEVIIPNGLKKNPIKKSTAAAATNSREETATPESLGKRKRKATVFDDFSYSIDSEDDAESHINNYHRINHIKSNQVTTFDTPITSATVVTTIKSENEYPCPRCPAQFETRVGLTNHLKLHGANKTFPCHSCDFSCTNRKTMRQHKRVHGQSAPARKRKSVDVKKPSPFNYDNILGNDGKKPKRTFPCPWCCYKTHTFARLIPHKLGHFRAHGYQCPNCTFR